MTTEIYSPGLEGVLAGETAISTVTDGLSYRGYPSQQPGYVSPRSHGFDSGYSQPSFDYNRPRTLPSYDDFGGGLQTLPRTERTYKIRLYSKLGWLYPESKPWVRGET